MAFNGLLTLVSDCYTVMIKGAVNFLAVDCSCQVLGVQNGLPKGQCTYSAMMLVVHLGNNSVAPIHNIGNLSNSQVSQSIKAINYGSIKPCGCIVHLSTEKEETLADY
jgi:hypothetical protein